MKLFVVLISVVILSTHALWIIDLNSTKAINSDTKTPMQVKHSGTNNSGLLKKVSLETYDKVGDSEHGKNNSNSIEYSFNEEGKFEGRGKKMDDMMLPLIFGGVGAGTMSIAIAAVKALVMKALLVGKIALILTIILLVGKLMDKEHGSAPHVEVEHYGASEVYPIYTKYSAIGGGGVNGYSDTNGGPYGDMYNNLHAGGAAETVLNYATVQVPGINNTLTGVDAPQHIPIGRRRDQWRRKAKVPMVLTIRQYKT